MKKQSLFVVTLVSFLLVPALSLASNCHEEGKGHDSHDKVAMSHGEKSGDKMDHGSMDHGKMEHDSMQMKGGMIMLGEQEVEDVKANIHMKDVRETMAKMGMDATHHFMIALTDAKSGKTLEEGVVAVKIKGPKGEEGQAIQLMGMQGHFGVDVSLKEPGEYHFTVATKLADGKTRKFMATFTNTAH